MCLSHETLGSVEDLDLPLRGDDRCVSRPRGLILGPGCFSRVDDRYLALSRLGVAVNSHAVLNETSGWRQIKYTARNGRLFSSRGQAFGVLLCISEQTEGLGDVSCAERDQSIGYRLWVP